MIRYLMAIKYSKQKEVTKREEGGVGGEWEKGGGEGSERIFT